MINVTKTFLPPFEEYMEILKKTWDKHWITNRGPLTLELEEKLKDYLGVDNILITNNGTVPLQIAIKLLGIGGEIITTPFSYVATTAVIVWENCKPVFVDIDPKCLTIDETQIEAAITPKTTAILATHVFGNPCNIEAIKSIADKYNLKVIYDAAHCFGVKYKGESIFNFGDISTCSFHATKLFHTGEGGAMFSKNEILRKQFFHAHLFGHNGPYEFIGLGLNGKISDLQAAMGLSLLPHIEKIISCRKRAVDFYNHRLDFSNFDKLELRAGTEWNYSYYPVIFKSEKILLEKMEILAKQNIFPRRYFYPSLNTIEYAKGKKMPISESVSTRVLCLPLFADLNESDQEKICTSLNGENDN
jgi:dTDP-4-amino-4,6-dideoxygalactose transaminase